MDISELIACSALVYALVILCYILASHTPKTVLTFWTAQVVEWSTSLYRLLLAAYPATFRAEYGEAMAQLFRDAARAEYRQRGLCGLLALWMRTLLDWTISVVREHRDKPAAASSETVLLRDLLRQWGQLGRNALSVCAFSLWYGSHLLHAISRRTLLIWTLLTVAAFAVWVGSFVKPIGTRIATQRAAFSVNSGSLEIYHIYEVGEPISWERYLSDGRLLLTKDPTFGERLQSAPWLGEFSFLSEIPWATGLRHGRDGMPTVVVPYKQWRLRIPFVFIPALLLCWTIRVHRRGNAVSGPAMQSV